MLHEACYVQPSCTKAVSETRIKDLFLDIIDYIYIYIYSVHTCYITRNIISVNRILDGKSEYNRLLGINSCR